MGALTRITQLFALAVLGAGCGPERGGTGVLVDDSDGVFCNVSTDELASVLGPEGIISLQDPPFIPADHADASYVADNERVVGFILEGEPLAIPLNVLRFHEVVNLTRATASLAMTFCPLTGSSLVFDRSGLGGVEMGVSGLLHFNNLVMYDRAEPASFFTQMRGGAATCGPSARTGASLSVVPSVEIRWDAWKRLHPNTVVVSQDTGDFSFGSYEVNIHADYERIDNPFLLIPFPIDPRLPPKERVLGVPIGGDGGLAFAFEELRRQDRQAVSALNGSGVVFWDRSADAAMAFSTQVDGQELSFATTANGFVDVETGSDWRFDGLATSGALAGRRLEQITGAFVSFWFAWAAFFPETVVWDGSGG